MKVARLSELLRASAASLACICGCGGGGSSDTLHDASTSDAPPGDAAADAPTLNEDSGTILDAGTSVGDADATSPLDAAPPPPPLACTAWRFATPITLDDLSLDDASGAFNSLLSISEPAAGTVRVVAQPTTGVAFRIYTLDKTTSTLTPLDGPANSASTFGGARHVSVGTSTPVTQILVSTPIAGSESATLTAYLVPDAIAPTGPLPAPFTVATTGGTAALLPLDDTDLFAAIHYLSVDVPPDIGYSLVVGRATPTTQASLATVATSNQADDFLFTALAHAGGEVYLFASNGAATLGESSWVVPDTAVVPAPPTSRAFDTGTLGQMVDVAPGVLAPGSMSFAYTQEPADHSSLTVRVGAVDDGDLGAVTASTLSAVRTYTDPSERPTQGSPAQWSGDDIVFVGPPPAAGDGGTTAGANLLWVDARGVVRAERVGSNAILQDHGASLRQMVAGAVNVTATSAQIDVAWVEQKGSGSVLLYDELDCQPGD